MCTYRRICQSNTDVCVKTTLAYIYLLYLKGLYKFRTIFAPSQIYILLGVTCVLLRLLFATILRLAYDIRLLVQLTPGL